MLLQCCNLWAKKLIKLDKRIYKKPRKKKWKQSILHLSSIPQELLHNYFYDKM